MTVTTAARTVSYTAPGGSFAFPVPFQFYQIEVVTRTGGVETVIDPADYVVTGGSGATGTATFAPDAGLVVTIRGKTRRGQSTRYGDFANFPMDAHQKSMDLLAMSVIEQDRDIGDIDRRALLVPPGETAAELPSVSGASEGAVLAWSPAVGGFILAPNTSAAVADNVTAAQIAAATALANRVLSDADALQTTSDRNVAAAQAGIAIAANGLPPTGKYQSWASRTTPPSGVSTTQTYWVLDATASNLILYLNTSGTGAAATFGGFGVSWPLTPSLATLAADLAAATSYPSGATSTEWIGANALVAGQSPALPGSQHLTISDAFTHAGTIDKIFVHTFDTADIHVQLMRGGTQVGSDYVYSNTLTTPQYIDVGIPNVQVGDKVRYTNAEFAYTTPAIAGDAGIDELDHTTYGFRIGARLTYSTGSMPLKDKVAELDALVQSGGGGGGGGGTTLEKKGAMWGDSLTAYVGHAADSPPGQLATILGIPFYNGGASGETSSQIRARFTAASDKFGWINIFKPGRNNFSVNNGDDVMADLKVMFALLSPDAQKRCLILAIWKGDGEYPGGVAAANAVAIDKLNARIQKAYPDNYVDSYTHIVTDGLLDNGLTPTSQDLVDIGHGIIPEQMRLSGDYLHGNAYAYGTEARLIVREIQSRWWLA